MADDFPILRRQLAECRANLHDTQAELAGVRRELVSARSAATASAMELGAAQAEIDRLKALLETKSSGTCADLVTDFDAPQLQRVPCGHALPCPLHSPPATKPSESSMVQRIEAPKSSEQSLMEENERLRTALMKIRGAATRPTFARAACEGIVLVVNLALDGPPDPERDREPRAEVERP